ncbi:hypothetical protein LTR16_010181, partial [Cryomyces antarcticus]
SQIYWRRRAERQNSKRRELSAVGELGPETKSKTDFWIDIAGALQRMRGERYGARSCQPKVQALVTARRKQLLAGDEREKDKTALTQAVDKWITTVEARQAVLDSETYRKAEIEKQNAVRVAAREAMLKTRRERASIRF